MILFWFRRLRSDNKELHLKVASIQKSSGAGGEATDDDVASLHVEALKARKTYDALHLQCNANKKAIISISHPCISFLILLYTTVIAAFVRYSGVYFYTMNAVSQEASSILTCRPFARSDP